MTHARLAVCQKRVAVNILSRNITATDIDKHLCDLEFFNLKPQIILPVQFVCIFSAMNFQNIVSISVLRNTCDAKKE